MREISMKEIAIYNALNKVPTVFLPNFATNQATTSSVQNLTENFILGLVAGFPSTEMTVFRTSNKLQAPGKVSQAENDTNRKVVQNEGCILCFGSIDNTCSLENATALRHTLFSETINTNEAHVTYNDPTINIMEIPPPQDLEQTLNQSVCYACRLLRKEISDPGKNLLFPTIAKITSTYRNSNPKDIKESLRDMLLQD
uniref:Cytoplasmic tRNA 2-thiolation protein 2 n=1 Tax=Ciona savignyi TaxID=51511 RepID=H2Z0Q4_CIOSA